MRGKHVIGWGWRKGSSRLHFFDAAGRSLCRRWRVTGRAKIPEWVAFIKCAECDRRAVRTERL